MLVCAIKTIYWQGDGLSILSDGFANSMDNDCVGMTRVTTRVAYVNVIWELVIDS
jgi:hypothetical protein